jgi:hypothetical protein
VTPAPYLEAGDRDFLNAHDGTEFLHRILWDLDLSHEYCLVRNAEHGGPAMRPRLHHVCLARNPLESDAAGCIVYSRSSRGTGAANR